MIRLSLNFRHLRITSSGSTPLGMYKKLIQFYKEGKLSFKYVKTFNMDEYVGLPSNHPESYHYYMYENFFKHIDIDPGLCTRIVKSKLGA